MNKPLRLPCLQILSFNKGHLSKLPLSSFRGHKVALCWIPTLREADAWILEKQVTCFKNEDTHFMALATNEGIFSQSWIRPPHEFTLPLLIDPLHRIQKALRLSPSLPCHRGETVFFSRENCLTFRLIHDLTDRGLATALDIAGSEFCQDPKAIPKRSEKNLVSSSY